MFVFWNLNVLVCEKANDILMYIFYVEPSAPHTCQYVNLKMKMQLNLQT